MAFRVKQYFFASSRSISLHPAEVFLCILKKYFFASRKSASLHSTELFISWTDTLYIIAMAFNNLALFETWHYVPNSSKKVCDKRSKPKVVIFVA